MKRLLFALFVGLWLGAPQAQTPGFDCARASRAAERLVCEHPDLAQADADLNLLYQALRAKPTRPEGLRAAQRRWLSQTRDRCADVDCLRSAYRQRVAELQAFNARPLAWQGRAFEPLFTRAIPFIDDTRVLRGLRLRAERPTRLQLELHVDPGDRLQWRLPGPLVRVHCTDPDWREGYAGRFTFQAQAHGVQFTPVQRDGAQGFVLLPLNIGRDALPLKQDIVCSVAFTEWLLERPSALHLVAAP